MSDQTKWLICCIVIYLSMQVTCLKIQPLQGKSRVAASSSLNISSSPNWPLAAISANLPHRISRIIGGDDAVEGEIPWQVGLRQKNNLEILFCGGTLLSSRVVVTAAHCLNGDNDFFVGLGGLKESNFPIKCNYKDIIKHEMYSTSATTPQHDIALIILDRDVTSSNRVQPAAIPWRGYDATGMAIISGWGYINNNDEAAETLQVAEVQIWVQDECVSAYENVGNQVTDDMICAGYYDYSRDACTGDSGGPLVVNNDINGIRYDILVGITSWGPNDQCAKEGFPGVYTRVTSYTDWIHETACNAGYCILDVIPSSTTQQTMTTSAAISVFVVNTLIMIIACFMFGRWL